MEEMRGQWRNEMKQTGSEAKSLVEDDLERPKMLHPGASTRLGSTEISVRERCPQGAPSPAGEMEAQGSRGDLSHLEGFTEEVLFEPGRRGDGDSLYSCLDTNQVLSGSEAAC